MVLGVVHVKMLYNAEKKEKREKRKKRKKEKKTLYIYQYNACDILSGQRKPALQCVRNTYDHRSNLLLQRNTYVLLCNTI